MSEMEPPALGVVGGSICPERFSIRSRFVDLPLTLARLRLALAKLSVEARWRRKLEVEAGEVAPASIDSGGHVDASSLASGLAKGRDDSDIADAVA